MGEINKIVIVGGGSAGWMTAATLIKAFPDKDIFVIESKDVPTVGVGESTIGGIRNWTRFIGLEEKDFFLATDASLKLSIKFTDFYRKDGGAFHYPFGQAMAEPNSNPFFYWHLKKFLYPETPTEDFVQCLFPAAALFENNKFSLNNDGAFDIFNAGNDVAYHFDATKFGVWLREFICKPNGVTHLVSTVTSVITNDSGVEKLILETGEEVYADLFVDCTGFKSLLLGDALQEPFRSLSNLLPNNRAWATRLAYEDKEKELEGFTNCTAIENGWCWNIPLWSRLGTGYVYSDKFVDPETAKEEFKQYLMSDKMIVPRTREQVDALEFKDVKMRVGLHERTFVKNVVAIGLSAGFIEPLESNGLFSVHEFLFKLVDILQRGRISQFDRDMYNVNVRTLFDNFSKFVTLHYALSHRDDTPYWEDIQNKSFTAWDNDPYTPHLGKSDAFNNIIWRYMDEWGHPYGMQGITYVATGLQLFMINEARFMNLSYRLNRDLVEEARTQDAVWNARKEKWKRAADNSPTLKQFLEENFYGKKDS
jgi:flavin-dependent dehydrogenase